MQTSPEIPGEELAVPYAWSGLQSATASIRVMMDEMPKLREKIAKLLPVNKERAREYYDDLCRLHKKLAEVIGACRPYLLEMGLEQEAVYAIKLLAAVRAFSVMTPDYSKLIAALDAFLSGQPGDEQDEDGLKTTNASVIGRLMNNVRMGYYATNLEHVEHITRGIAFPEGVVTNLLDPCCGEGYALRRLADGNGCLTYGVEIDEARAEEAQDRLHRVGVGSFFRSRISHEAFHLLFLNPPYIQVVREGGGMARSEKMFLVDAIPHLAMKGLLAYIVPFYRITADIARVLCDNFADLSVYRFMSKEFDRFHQAVVFGLRRPKADGSELVNNFLDRVATADRIPEIAELPDGRYALPAEPLTVHTFKGAVFNELELQRQLKASKSIAKLLERSELDGREKRPLLPLNIGQIGLIAGSGMINGLAECETPHVIKGRIVKEIQRSVTKHKKVEYMTETHTNRMIFNILTPGGFRSLS